MGCHRCESFCPTDALIIRHKPQDFRKNDLWDPKYLKYIYKQADTGGVLLTGMGAVKQCSGLLDKMLLDASQVTNPSIDPLREPMELKTFLGAKPTVLKVEDSGGKPTLKTRLTPQVELSTPIMFAAMSFGPSISICISPWPGRRWKPAPSTTRARADCTPPSINTARIPSCRWPRDASACTATT